LIEKACEHLYAAFEAKAPLLKENVLWLSGVYYSRIQSEIDQGDLPSSKLLLRTASLLENLVARNQEITLETELYYCELGKIYLLLERAEVAISLLEKLTHQYASNPSLSWKWATDVKLTLGECYAAQGKDEAALPLFDSVIKEKASLRTLSGATASLKSARIRIEKWLRQKLSSDDLGCLQALTQLKDLVLQKTLLSEPLHLEAALDYIDLQTRLDPKPREKRLALLLKTKEDFESANDLLSKDYHEARARNPRKDRIYQAYLRYLDAEIYSAQSALNENAGTQKELQAKAKDVLLHIIDEKAHPSILDRARKRLENAPTPEQQA
jgi:hypothetical protein